ncbi:Dynein regulatory complex protein 10 [Amphibalanus amphitrite]|uniref:Dynein regulatory complex protein 10 n=1 Tax=Amphibalanus amphitrite TaxID=1232801 RepID=A0A6A4VG63_AMPAM|nr:Dynein regulatory complex protein 10 [Amphibalanus amphitrite]
MTTGESRTPSSTNWRATSPASSASPLRTSPTSSLRPRETSQQRVRPTRWNVSDSRSSTKRTWPDCRSCASVTERPRPRSKNGSTKLSLSWKTGLQKYDAEMMEKTEEIECLQAEFEKETAEREEYDAKVEAIRDRYDSIILKRERREEQRIFEEQLAIKKAAAALYIQAFWRGYRVRKRLKKGKKGKGKKGKKGGGKKGGKSPKGKKGKKK